MKKSKEDTNAKTAKIVQKNTIDHEYGHDWMVCFLPVVPLLILGVIAVIEMLFESSNNQYFSASYVYTMLICELALAVMVFVLLLDLPLIICARDAYRITPVARRGLLKTGIIIHIIALALPVILFFRNLAFENPIVIIVLLATAIYATWSLNKVYTTITNHLASKGK